jgi:hypothetical protein
MEAKTGRFLDDTSHITTDSQKPKDLDASGVNVVLTTTLYAIIGAIALQKGGDVAARVARERVLKPLGIA